MSIKSDFEKLEALYGAIIDLNKVLEDKSSDTRFDDAINCIKEINKSDFDKSIEEDIIKSIKDAVLKIYTDESDRLNKALTDTNKIDPINAQDYYPKDLVAIRKENTRKYSDTDLDTTYKPPKSPLYSQNGAIPNTLKEKQDKAVTEAIN